MNVVNTAVALKPRCQLLRMFAKYCQNALQTHILGGVPGDISNHPLEPDWA